MQRRSFKKLWRQIPVRQRTSPSCPGFTTLKHQEYQCCFRLQCSKFAGTSLNNQLLQRTCGIPNNCSPFWSCLYPKLLQLCPTNDRKWYWRKLWECCCKDESPKLLSRWLPQHRNQSQGTNQKFASCMLWRWILSYQVHLQPTECPWVLF